MGFVSWNCFFKASINLSKSISSYDTFCDDGKMVKVNAKDIEIGAIEIVKALKGTYMVEGKRIPVNGDLTKLKFVAGLSPIAKQILSNVQSVSRKMSGTQETRRQMRFDINAMRVK